MPMPGFTAENSTHATHSYSQSKAHQSPSSGMNQNLVYLQLPNRDNTAGGACHATSASGTATVNTGTYNSDGYCCGPKLSNGSQLCINCDVGTCSDGNARRWGMLDRSTFDNVFYSTLVV
jgi:hypothetical protein